MKTKPSLTFGGLAIVAVGGHMGIGSTSLGVLLLAALLVLAGLVIAAAGAGGA
jgi:hypothetical protein